MYTDIKVAEKLAAMPEAVRSDHRYSWLGEGSETELLAFFGFFYARGLIQSNFMDLNLLYNNVIGHPIFSSIISKNRFKFILSMLRFDDAETREERWKTDRFAAFRGIFDMVNKMCARNMSPDNFLAIDETLYPTRGSISFKIYNKDKPSKYGLNFLKFRKCLSRKHHVHCSICWATSALGTSYEVLI